MFVKYKLSPKTASLYKSLVIFLVPGHLVNLPFRQFAILSTVIQLHPFTELSPAPTLKSTQLLQLLLGEMPNRQNAKQTKCQIDKMPYRQNAKQTKCQIDKMPNRQNGVAPAFDVTFNDLNQKNRVVAVKQRDNKSRKFVSRGNVKPGYQTP